MMRLPSWLIALLASSLLAARALAQDAGVEQAPPAAEAGVEQETPISVLPKLLETVQATYPERALAERVQADVVLEIDIDAAGVVEAARALEASATGYGFEEAAVEAARKFRFSPAMAGESAVPVRITYRYRFVPAPPEPAPEVKATPAAPPVKQSVINLQGQLLVRGTREPIAGVTVTAFRGPASQPEQAFEATTDSAGRFAFYDLAPGAWNVLVEAEGFFPVRSTETVAAGERTDVRYFVERGDYSPFDVLVEAARPRREVNRTSLETPQIERIPGTAGDVLQVVQNLPGVARAAPFSGQIIVRGSAPEDTKTVVEGMNIPLIYHFGGLRSVIPTPMLQGIDFYPGNFAPAFGRATGGIIDVRLKRLEPKRFGGKADISIIDSSLYLETPLGEKGALAIAARRSYLDVVIAAAAAGSEEEINLVTAPRYYDAQLLAQYSPAPGHDLRVFGLLSNDQLRVLFGQPVDDGVLIRGNELRSETGFYRGIFEYAYRPREAFSNVLSIAVGDDSSHTKYAQFTLNRDTLGIQLRDTASLRVNQHLRLEAGVDELVERNSHELVLPGQVREGEAQTGNGPFDLSTVLSSRVEGQWSSSLGAFASVELRYGGLSLLPGVRYDYFTRVDEQRVAPRFTTRYQLDERWTLKGGVGLFYQEPTLDETDPNFGNPELDPKGAVHYSLGVEYRPTKYLTFDATAFYKTLFDQVARTDRVVQRNGELVEERLDNSGEGRVVGGEFLLRHELAHNFMGWVSYTVMRAERKDSPDDPWRLFDYDQTHIFTALGTYRLPRNWEVGFRFRLVSGNPRTPVTGTILNSDADEYSAVHGRTNSARLPVFHQLDLRIDKQWIYTQWRFSAYLDIQNVYNRANPEEVQFNFDYSKRNYSQGLPILPIFGLRAEY
jgi:TonB family protein